MSETKTDHPLADLIEQYKGAEGDSLIRDNHDWVQINAALTEWVQRVPIPDVVLAGMMDWLKMMRLVIQMVYILGYRRGKREAQMPVFIVAEQEEAE